jgi:hypothetical protein
MHYFSLHCSGQVGHEENPFVDDDLRTASPSTFSTVVPVSPRSSSPNQTSKMNGLGRNSTSDALSRDPYTMRSKAGSTSGSRDVGGSRDGSPEGSRYDKYTVAGRYDPKLDRQNKNPGGSRNDKYISTGRYDPKLDLQNPTSIFRENLRLRVREDEKRLGEMIRRRGGGDYNSSPADESKSNNENGGRDNGRAMMRGNGGPDSFLYDKLLEIEDGFSIQARKIRALEGSLIDREDEIQILRSELERKIGTIVQYEIELKSMAPRAIDEDLLSLTGELYDVDLDGSIRGNDSAEGQRARLMVAKLLADLRNLENRYKDDQTKAAKTIESLRLENGELRENKTKMVVDLERRVQEIEEECVRLGRSVEVKDRQIDNLKRELATFTLNQMSRAGDGQFSDFDRELLRSSPSAYERDAARTSSFRRNRDEEIDTPRRFDGEDRAADREREEPSYRSRSSSPGRNIRFAENLNDKEPLSKTKESQLELIRQSRARSGSFDRSAGRDSNALTEEDIFPRSGERGRSGYNEVSGRRSDNRQAVKQDQEQAIQRAKSNGLFGRASRRLFGRA